MQRLHKRRESAVWNARRGGLPRAPFRKEGRSRQTANCKHTPTERSRYASPTRINLLQLHTG